MAQFHSVLHERRLKANYLLIQNVRALLAARGVDDKALAMFCGHKPAWLSKIMAGERGISLPDLDKVADFFGLTVAQLLSHGISPLTERRKGDRRSVEERRKEERRRGPLGRLHREMPPFTDREYPGGNNDGSEGVM
jgi:transcriptional regulator with XRE-family HTH domain